MSSTHQPAEPSVACFAVRGAADPGTLPRILELFAKRGLVPFSVHSRMSGEGDEALLIVDLQVEGLSPEQSEIVAEQLRQIFVIDRVLTARKRLLRSAA